MMPNIPVVHLHRSEDDEPRKVDGVKVYPTLCGRWEVMRDFEESAPMGGRRCRECDDRDRRPGQYRDI